MSEIKDNVQELPWLADVNASVVEYAGGKLTEGAELEGHLDAIAKKHKSSVRLVRTAFRAEVKKYVAPVTNNPATSNPADNDATKSTLAFAIDPEPVAKSLSANELLECIVKIIQSRTFCAPEIAYLG